MDDLRVRRGRALWRLAPGFVVVSTLNGRSLEMGGSAVAVWNLLPAPDAPSIAVDALVDALVDAHGASPATVAGDTIRVLRAWEEIGAVVFDA